MKLFYNFTGFRTLLWREIFRFLKVYFQTIIGPLFTSLLFLAVFGATFETREVGIDGVGYLGFLVPGLCAMGAITNAFSNPSSSIIIQKYHHSLQDLNSYPLTSLEKTLAFVIGGTLRGLIVGVMTYAATIPFIGATIASPVLFFVFLAVISAVFSAIGMICGFLMKSFDQLGFATTIILTPLTYLGGVFFEVSKLPGALSTAAQFNPIFPLVDTLRWTYLGVQEGSLLFNLIYVGILFFGTFGFAWWTIHSGKGLKN